VRRADHYSREVIPRVVCLSVTVKPRYWGSHGPPVAGVPGGKRGEGGGGPKIQYATRPKQRWMYRQPYANKTGCLTQSSQPLPPPPPPPLLLHSTSPPRALLPNCANATHCTCWRHCITYRCHKYATFGIMPSVFTPVFRDDVIQNDIFLNANIL
jgi:hypothetical protein